MSKLMERLERLRKAGPAPMGFGAAIHRERTAPMLLLASIDSPKQVKAVAKGLADGLLFNSADWDPEAISGLDSAAGTLWGVMVKEPSVENVAALQEKGCDFVAFEAASVLLDALNTEEMGRMFIIPPELDEQQARALESMPVDMLLLSTPTTSPLTLQDLVTLAALRRQVGKPFLLPASKPLSEWELQCLRDIGIDGIVLSVEQSSIAALEEMRSLLNKLPPRSPKRERFTPLIPQGALDTYALPSQVEEEEEEPEEDEE